VNFAAFQLWREQCLRAKPDLLDCAETNLYRALEELQPPQVKSLSNHLVHRCDLARTWLRRYAFSESLSRLALVCRGVRHALQLVFLEIARNNAVLWAPSDVYPKYQELARVAGIEPRLFPTLPNPELPSKCTEGAFEYLLVANPWKPLGRFITDQECTAISDWLEASPNRCLLIDCVYDLCAPFHFTTRNLQKTGRTVLLHSVTKGWLRPKTCGVALLGESHPQLERAFRDDPPSQAQLQQGEGFLSDMGSLPGQVMSALDNRRNQLLSALPKAVAQSFLLDPSTIAPGCYFFPVRLQIDELLREHGMVGIPTTAFGGTWGGSILSSLSHNFTSRGKNSRRETD
jgi:hypothetical protein